MYYPPSAWAEYDMASRGSRGRALEETNGPEAEAAYNLTSGFLRLKTRFAFGKQWTFEGWHYMKERGRERMKRHEHTGYGYAIRLVL